MKKNNIAVVSGLMVVVLLSIITACDCSAQHVTIIAPDGAKASGFRTDLGVVTVAHIEGVRSKWVNRKFDCRLIDSDVGQLHEVGDGQPEYFICRRGRRHNLKVLSTTNEQWICDVEFFNGESGLPIYDGQGQVVGYVVGNRVGKRYKGIIGRLLNVPEFAIAIVERKSKVLKPQVVEPQRVAKD